MESETSSQLSQISLEGLNLPLSSQQLDDLIQINSQDMLDVSSQEFISQQEDVPDQNDSVDFLELSSQQMADLIPKDAGDELSPHVIEELFNDMEVDGKTPTCSNTPTQGFQCPQCPKLFEQKKRLNEHMKTKHQGRKFPCQKCGREFERVGRKNRHEKSCQGADHICVICGKRCSTAGGLRRHMESHTGQKRKNSNPSEQQEKKIKRSPPADNNTASQQKCKKLKTVHSSQEPGPSGVQPGPSNAGPSHQPPHEPAYHCRRCTYICNNRRELYLHGMREHYQHGGALHPVPWGDNPAPWEQEDGAVDEALREVYESNAPLILQNHETGPVQSTFNFPITNDVSVEQLMRYVDEIYNEQQHSFRINFSFGVILQNRETGEYRYFTAYTNNVVLDNPMFISRRPQLRRLFLQLRRMDILNELLFTRPDTKWVPVLITNVQFFVTSTNYPVGVGNLPDYLMKKESLYPLVKDQQTRRVYDDHLCLFRCLALHRKHDIKSLEGATKQYYSEWRKHNKSNKEFCGVVMEEFPDFETCFNINLEVYSLQENDSCLSIYKSRGRYDTSMYINLYQNHVSYIKNFASYAKKFQCSICERLFDQSCNFHRHMKTCSNKTTYKYHGGFHQTPDTIFDKLEQFEILVPDQDRTFQWFICYDFEAMLQKVNKHQTEYLKWTAQHIPISVSICSNVEGYKHPICFVEADQDRLVEQMLAGMSEIATKVKELAEDKWGYVLEQLTEKLNTTEDKKALQEIETNFKSYISQVPVLGFNSAKYDLNLVKKTIAKHLCLHEEKNNFVVKQGNSYKCIGTKDFKFLDVSHYLAAGSSYSSFLKAYNVTEQKGYFPYEWFDDIDKLECLELPCHEAFYSALKNKNITEEEYQYCQRVWRENNMKTFKDFLIYYNNLDVGPFVMAVEQLQQFYFEKGIDVFKTSISVPGIARQLLFRSARENNTHFALFDQNNADLHQTIKNNLTGGPSIIFTRHHKAGETQIRGGKLCKKIQGMDANSLYLECIGRELPTGAFIRRRAPEFEPEVRDKYMAAYYWMDYLIENHGVKILHKLNHGKEVRVGGYLVDGFQAAAHAHERPTCYQFHGCYFHGHQCDLTKNIKDKKWLEMRETKFKKTQDITKHLKQQGCNVVEMYECEFKQYCRSNPSIYQFMNKHRPTFYQKHRSAVGENQILKAVLGGSLFGMVEVDIRVPKEWPTYFSHHTMTPYEYFQEMSPLFCTTDIPHDVIGKHMQDHIDQHNLSKAPRRLLVGGVRAEQILIATPLLQWYLKHGLTVTKIYQVVEFQSKRCFKKFVEEVSDARRAGDIHPDKAIIGETTKTIGNSSYGSLIMDRSKHRSIKYVQGENATCLKVNEPQFRKLDCLDPEEQFYEVEMAKKIIHLDLPIQLGYFILQYAKLRMLEFYYDFMDKYVDRADFEYIEMDTDSAYFAISGSCLADVIKPEMKAKYEKGLKGFCTDQLIEGDTEYHWFPRTCCSKHAKYDKRTPGLFKLEYEGEEMIGLCSKTYIVRNGQHYKFSSKGVNKTNVTDPMETFQQVLTTGQGQLGLNRGFRVKGNSIFTYTQQKRGFSYFYCKRGVLDDGIHTVPLDITLCPIPNKEQQDDVDADDEVRDALAGLLDEN